MKKLIALIISIVFIFTMAIPAFAETVSSPQNPVNYIVTCYGVQGVKDGSTSSVLKGSQVTLTADETRGVFDKWTISGNYSIVSGDLNSKSITIKPDSDVTVKAGFNANPDVSYRVTCVGVSGLKNGGIITVNRGESFTVTPNETLGTFVKWGVTGSYDIVSGSLNEKTLTLTPKSNLVVIASTVNIKPGQNSPTDTNNSGNYDVTAGSGAVPTNNGSAAAGSWTGNGSVIGFNSKHNQITVEKDDTKGNFERWTVVQQVTDESGETTTIPTEPGVGYVPVIDPDEFGKTLPGTVTSGEDYKAVANELKAAMEEVEKEAKEEDKGTNTANATSPAKERYIKAFENYVSIVASKTNKTVSQVINDILKSPVLTIIPLADIIIYGNYSGQGTGEQTTSPKSGDYSVYFVLIALFSLAGIAVTSKKVFSK